MGWKLSDELGIHSIYFENLLNSVGTMTYYCAATTKNKGGRRQILVEIFAWQKPEKTQSKIKMKCIKNKHIKYKCYNANSKNEAQRL